MHVLRDISNSSAPETSFLGGGRRAVQDKRQSAENRLGTQDHTLGLFFRRSPQAVERGEGGVGVIANGRVQWIVGVVPIDGIEGTIRHESLSGIQRIVRHILTGLVEDVVVASALLIEDLLSKGESDDKE